MSVHLCTIMLEFTTDVKKNIFQKGLDISPVHQYTYSIEVHH